MLKNEVVDTPFEPIIEKVREVLSDDQKQYLLESPKFVKIEYPHEQWPSKVKSLKLDKVPIFTGKLVAVKGQYLIFDSNEVLNIRSHSGYHISLSRGLKYITTLVMSLVTSNRLMFVLN